MVVTSEAIFASYQVSTKPRQDHYLAEAGATVALDFIDALEDARRQIGVQPASGSPRYAHELGIPGLRCRTVKGFPYVVFHVEREAEVDVWRVLHGARDIPAWMQEPGDD